MTPRSAQAIHAPPRSAPRHSSGPRLGIEMSARHCVLTSRELGGASVDDVDMAAGERVHPAANDMSVLRVLQNDVETGMLAAVADHDALDLVPLSHVGHLP